MTAANRTVWAIVWQHVDASWFGVSRVYSNHEEALEDMDRMASTTPMKLRIVSAPMIDAVAQSLLDRLRKVTGQ